MNSKHGKLFACAVALCGSVCSFAAGAAESEKSEQGVAEEKAPQILTAEASLTFDSKFMSYGLVDNNDPIVTPAVSIKFLDALTFDLAALFDVTKYGKKAGYGNRGGRYQELDAGISLGWSWSPEDYDFLPTTIETSIGYMYEYHPEHMQGWRYPEKPGANTQFVTAEIALPDLWLEPVLAYERDLMRDNGTYLNLEIGHTFTLIEGEDDDSVLDLRVFIGQGFGNKPRVAGYLTKADEEPLAHAGLMDTSIGAELEWAFGDHVKLVGGVTYFDYLFDSMMREAARRYEATGRCDRSYNVVASIGIGVSF